MPQCAVTSPAIVVGFDIFKQDFTHLGAAYETLAMDEFDLRTVEETLGTGIVVAVTLRAQTASQVMGTNQLLVTRSLCAITSLGCLRRHPAMHKATQIRSAVKRSPMAQPITIREYRSMTTARYSQPSSECRARFRFGTDAVKSC